MNSTLKKPENEVLVVTDNGLPPAGGFEAQDAFAKGGDVWKNYCATHGRRQGYLAKEGHSGVSIYTPLALPEGFDAFLARYRAHRAQLAAPVAEKAAEPRRVLVDISLVRCVNYWRQYCPDCNAYLPDSSIVETTAGRRRLIQCRCGEYFERD